MYRQFYAGSPLMDFPLFALLFFVALFATVIVRMMILKRPRDFEEISRLPLVDEYDSTLVTQASQATEGGHTP